MLSFPFTKMSPRSSNSNHWNIEESQFLDDIISNGQSSDDPIHFLFWRENMFKSGWKRLPSNFHWNKLKTKKTCFKTSLVRSFTWIRPSTPVESILKFNNVNISWIRISGINHRFRYCVTGSQYHNIGCTCLQYWQRHPICHNTAWYCQSLLRWRPRSSPQSWCRKKLTRYCFS